ncbi:MAG: hypothetical protein HFI94_05715 [Lachnospiraceae bacterium]|jgi:antitoxin component YwqK of YwqJK toxin-antitoxin module|nr:hypothetical protein [Lachnospiraceae bacterium]
MIKIKDIFQKREKNKEESFGRKILRHRLTILYRSILIIAVLAAASVVVLMQMKNRVFGGYQIVSSVEKEKLTDSVTMALGENILTYSNDGASCINKRGEALWDQPYEMQSPLINICQNVVAIGDYGGRTIYVMDTEKTLGEIDTKMPIRSFAVSGNGVVAAVLDDSANVTWIYLFDKSGKTLVYFKTTMKDSGYPICVTISENGYLVGVSYFYMDNGMMRSSVAFYNFGPVGQNEIDNFVSSYDYLDTVVPFVQFLSNDKAVAVADNRLVIFEGNQKPVSIADVLLNEEIEEVYYGNEYIALVCNDVTGKALYKVNIYNSSGKLADTVMLDMQFSDIIFHKDKMIAYNEQECVVHTIGGMDNFNGNFDKQVLTLIPMDSSYEYIAVTPDSIDTIELK